MDRHLRLQGPPHHSTGLARKTAQTSEFKRWGAQ